MEGNTMKTSELRIELEQRIRVRVKSAQSRGTWGDEDILAAWIERRLLGKSRLIKGRQGQLIQWPPTEGSIYCPVAKGFIGG
jgi:hypothetical protein